MAKKYVKDPRRGQGFPSKQVFVDGFKNKDAYSVDEVLGNVTKSGLILSNKEDVKAANIISDESSPIHKEKFEKLTKEIFPDWESPKDLKVSSFDVSAMERNVYNVNNHILSDEYTSFTLTRGGVLLRLYKRPLENKFGLFSASTVKGVSDSQFNKVNVDDPYRMLPLAVVVNMDPNLEKTAPFKIGDIVQVEPGLERTIVVGGSERIPIVQGAFARWDKLEEEFEGYVLHNMSKVIAVIQESTAADIISDHFKEIAKRTLDIVSKNNPIGNQHLVGYVEGS